MRGNMDPLAPTTHTLGPAISHIAETAASLSASMQSMPKPSGLGITVNVEPDAAESKAAQEKRDQKATVRWILDTPRRLQDLIDQEKDEDADKEWEEVSKILDKWGMVSGVAKLREECEAIMSEETDSE